MGAAFTATALSAAIATLAMAFLANLPVALASGMGLNAFFTYTVALGLLIAFVGIAEQANLKDENGAILSVKGGMLADATGTVVGACLGTSTVTSFIESASGVAAGARTGLSSLVTALFFVGFMMMKSVI